MPRYQVELYQSKPASTIQNYNIVPVVPSQGYYYGMYGHGYIISTGRSQEKLSGKIEEAPPNLPGRDTRSGLRIPKGIWTPVLVACWQK